VKSVFWATGFATMLPLAIVAVWLWLLLAVTSEAGPRAADQTSANL
jgi:hypothetical protein